MNLSNLLSSSEGVSNQTVQGTSGTSGFSLPGHSSLVSMHQQRYPSLPGIPAIAPQQILSNISPTLHQIKSGSAQSTMMSSGMNRQAKLEGPVSKKPKM